MDGGLPTLKVVTEDSLVKYLNVKVPLRDGTTLLSNIYQPGEREGERLPVLLNYSVYGKDGGIDISFFPPSSGLDRSRVTKEYQFEAADPMWWCSHGYVAASVDDREPWLEL